MTTQKETNVMPLSNRRGIWMPALAKMSVPGIEPAKECYLVIGNHHCYNGIGEILYTLNAYFSRHYATRVSERIVPNRLNVIIDEFANSELVGFLKECKQRNPATRYVLMATEFVTPLSFHGLSIGQTFNCFDDDDFVRHMSDRLKDLMRFKKKPPYLHARYLGFTKALEVADLVLCAHTSIAETMKLLPKGITPKAGQALTLYPELSVDEIKKDERLFKLPPGFVMTGTMTPYRQSIIGKLIKRYRQAGIYRPIFHSVSFDKSRSLEFKNHEIDFGYNDNGPQEEVVPVKSLPRVIIYTISILRKFSNGSTRAQCASCAPSVWPNPGGD